MFLVICSYENIPFTTMPPLFVASSTSCLLVITNYGWFYTPSYPYCWWLPSNNETWQWKIHRLVRWSSQLEHHLHRTFNCHVWLPECISLLNPDGIMYLYIYICTYNHPEVDRIWNCQWHSHFNDIYSRTTIYVCNYICMYIYIYISVNNSNSL